MNKVKKSLEFMMIHLLKIFVQHKSAKAEDPIMLYDFALKALLYILLLTLATNLLQTSY